MARARDGLYRERESKNKDLLSFIVVSQMVDDSDNVIGYVLIDEYCHSARYITLEVIENICSANDVKFLNASYNYITHTLDCTMGDWKDYGKVTSKYTIRKNSLTVYYKLKEPDSDEVKGVICYNALGTRYTLSMKKFLGLAAKYSNSNFDIVNSIELIPKSNSLYEDFPVIALHEGFNSKAIRSKEGEDDKNKSFAPAETATSLPTILATSFSDVEASDMNMDASFKFMEAKKNLMKIAPYYLSLLNAIPIHAKAGLGTLGVTENALYYDIEFVAQLQVSELTFILIHEISHMVMKHVVRVRNRDASLWNIATDLYINELICTDYGIRFGDEEKEINGGVLKTPKDGVFLSTINETLDFTRDTAEIIYDRLLKEEKEFIKPEDILKAKEKNPEGQQMPMGGGGQQEQLTKEKLEEMVIPILEAILKDSEEIEGMCK